MPCKDQTPSAVLQRNYPGRADSHPASVKAFYHRGIRTPKHTEPEQPFIWWYIRPKVIVFSSFFGIILIENTTKTIHWIFNLTNFVDFCKYNCILGVMLARHRDRSNTRPSPLCETQFAFCFHLCFTRRPNNFRNQGCKQTCLVAMLDFAVWHAETFTSVSACSWTICTTEVRDRALVLNALSCSLFKPQETTQPYSLSVRDIWQYWEFGTLQVLVEQQSCVFTNSLLALQVRLNGARVYDLEEGKYSSALLEKKTSWVQT